MSFFVFVFFPLCEWKRKSKETFFIYTQLFFNFLLKNVASTQKCQILTRRGNNVVFKLVIVCVFVADYWEIFNIFLHPVFSGDEMTF